MNKLTINDLDLRGKRVFIRVDFNVPLKDGVVTDDTRIRETLPTLRLAIEKGGRLVLASHLGRPKGGPDPKYSLRPAAKKLEELLGKPIAFALDCVGPGAEGQSKALRDGEVLVLENVRFHPDEEKNDEALMKIADAMLIGGGMAYTFLKADGQPIGKSLVEDDKLELARRLRDEARQKKFPLLLPVDHVVGAEFKADTATQTVSVSATPDGWMGLDIGPKTIEAYRQKIVAAKTIVWNGPMGVFEMTAFSKGTLEIAKAVAAATSAGATSIVGGGDSVAAVHQSGLADKISHISTGGGASLEFLAGRKLPGVEALTNK